MFRTFTQLVLNQRTLDRERYPETTEANSISYRNSSPGLAEKYLIDSQCLVWPEIIDNIVLKK